MSKKTKTFRKALKTIRPSKNVKKKDRPLKKLEGKNLRAYMLASFAAALLVGPFTVLARAHVDYLGGHRDRSVPEQIACVIQNPPPVWGVGFEPSCPIRQGDYE